MVWFHVSNTMLDEDLRRLGKTVVDHSLDGLEADVWRHLAERSQIRKVARRRASLQGILMIVAFVGSAAMGINSARSPTPANGPLLLAFGSELTPSSLLLGAAR